MKRMKIIGLLVSVFLSLHSIVEKKIMIVTPSYNNEKWYPKYLESVFNQEYDNWHLIYIDDASTDNTKNIRTAIEKAGKIDKVTLIRNTQRKGALENIYNAVHSCDPKTIIVLLDGDDRFFGTDVLSYINSVYADNSIWLTYGQFIESSSGKCGFCCDIPAECIQNNTIRASGYLPSHLRTFYAGLFHNIKKEDLMDPEGHFFMAAWDVAIMIPMIEMARANFKFIPKILYEYNDNNPISDHRISRWLQLHIDAFIRKRSGYAKLETLF